MRGRHFIYKAASMTNGETAKEVKSLLSEKGKISGTTAQRLTLDLLVQLYEKQEEDRNAREELKAQIDRVERASIVLWIQNNPKLALFFMTIYLLVTQLIDIRDVLAKALKI